MRSWRPFCWGLPGLIRTGVMPSLIHHTDSLLKPPLANEANGGPLSDSKKRAGRIAEQPLQLAAAAFIVGHQTTAAQQITAESVGHCQRVTNRPIAGAQPTLEIDAPDVIGRHNRWHPARRWRGPPAPFTSLTEPSALQQVTDGAQCWPGLLRRPRQQSDERQNTQLLLTMRIGPL